VSDTSLIQSLRSARPLIAPLLLATLCACGGNADPAQRSVYSGQAYPVTLSNDFAPSGSAGWTFPAVWNLPLAQSSSELGDQTCYIQATLWADATTLRIYGRPDAVQCYRGGVAVGSAATLSGTGYLQDADGNRGVLGVASTRKGALITQNAYFYSTHPEVSFAGVELRTPLAARIVLEN